MSILIDYYISLDSKNREDFIQFLRELYISDHQKLCKSSRCEICNGSYISREILFSYFNDAED